MKAAYLRSSLLLRAFHSYMKQENKERPLFSCNCVGFDLFSRAVASQVSSALQSLTSVFGMGTGGPSALEKPTRLRFSPSYYVSADLSSRAVASQVFSALQSLTSVFGMGTGGPSALKVLTRSHFCDRYGAPSGIQPRDAHRVPT